jgi:hypothetical protein
MEKRKGGTPGEAHTKKGHESLMNYDGNDVAD